MIQTLVLSKKFYESINKKAQLEIIDKHGYKSADDFINAIISNLNTNYSMFNIGSFRFFTEEENKDFSMYGAFVDNFKNDDFDRVLLCFTPIDSKLGNTIISQELMPLVNKELKSDIRFFLNKKIKKILLLTSQVNMNNTINDSDGNTLQLNVNILNNMGFDVLPFFHIKGLSSDSSFSNLDEYLTLLKDLRARKATNDQTEYIYMDDGIVYGQCEKNHISGQFSKFFTFRFYAAMMLGGNDYKYDVSKVTIHESGESHLEVLAEVVDYANNNEWESFEGHLFDSIEDISPINESEYVDINKIPERQEGTTGKRRFKTKRAIREKAISNNNYLCNCHDGKHFYFESSLTLENYVEGHHLIPMNRQELYWNDFRINLDVLFNIVPLCPNCHTQVHNGSRGAKLEILSEMYVRNEKNLKSVDKHISLSRLVSFYNISISKEEEVYLLKLGEKRVNLKQN